MAIRHSDDTYREKLSTNTSCGERAWGVVLGRQLHEHYLTGWTRG